VDLYFEYLTEGLMRDDELQEAKRKLREKWSSEKNENDARRVQ
jgi:hypothetical protein